MLSLEAFPGNLAFSPVGFIGFSFQFSDHTPESIVSVMQHRSHFCRDWRGTGPAVTQNFWQLSSTAPIRSLITVRIDVVVIDHEYNLPCIIHNSFPVPGGRLKCMVTPLTSFAVA